MRKSLVVVLSTLLLLGGFLAGRHFAPAAPGGHLAGGRKVLHYACPMHPAVHSDHPGTAPCCGMALEPVYEDGAQAGTAAATAHPAGTVTIPAGLRQLQGVKVGTVERAATTQALRLFGRVVPDETRVFSLNAALEGSIRELSGATSGSFVHRGQKLGAFFSADTRLALQAYITALDVQDIDPLTRANKGLQVAAGTTPSRSALFTVERLRGMGMSLEQIDEMRRKRDIPLTIDILSPADGLLLARNVTLGQKFDKGMEWFRIANLDRVWVLADLLEGDAPLARPGAAVKVTVPGRAGALRAVVSQVPPAFDPASRTLKVRLELDNPGQLLRPDMYVDAELTVERPSALVVPADAVVDTGLRRTVFVEQGEGVFEPRAVETGWRAGGRVEILSGLEAGERIVESGTFLVDSESQLRAAAAAPVAAPAVARKDHPGAARDPICGMDVDLAQARAAGHVAEHQGRTYAFCSDGCRAKFLASPGKFADAGGHDHAEAHVALHDAAGSRP